MTLVLCFNNLVHWRDCEGLYRVPKLKKTFEFLNTKTRFSIFFIKKGGGFLNAIN